MSDQASGPLSGVRVLDLTRVLSGPHCTRMLADLGADVIKVEPPEADSTRGIAQRVNGLSAYFTQQNAGKRYLCIDLDKPEGIELILKLVEQCDVLVDNFRPGVMDRLGMDEATLQRLNPRLVHCMISGFGQDSPARNKRAYAGVVHAMSGFVDSQARADKRPPVDSAHAIGDTGTGVHASNAICAALFMRERTGKGTTIDIAMHDVMLWLNETVGAHLFETPEALNLHWRGHVIEGKDGAIIYQGAPEWHFDEFMQVTGRHELKDDPRMASFQERRQHKDVLIEVLRQWVAQQPSIEQASRALEEHGHPNGVIRNIPQALESEEARARDMVREVDDRGGGQVKVLNSPYRYSNAQAGLRGPAGYRGEHNHQVITELLGYDEAHIERLEDAGVIIKTKKK